MTSIPTEAGFYKVRWFGRRHEDALVVQVRLNEKGELRAYAPGDSRDFHLESFAWLGRVEL